MLAFTARQSHRALRAALRTGATAALALSVAAPLARASDSFAIRGSHVVVGSGQVVADGVVWIENGKVKAAGADVQLPEGLPVVEHDGFVTPGLIGFGAAEGLTGEQFDSTRSLMPEAEVALGVDLSHRDFEALCRAGITSVVLTPSSQALAGGTTAVAKTAGNRLVSRDAHLALSFESAALDRERFPTSYGAAVNELDRRVEAGEGRFAEAAAGRLPVLMMVAARHQVLRAAGFAQRHGLRGAVMGGALTGEVADVLASAKLAAIVGPLSVGQSRRSLDAVLELHAAGVPLAFALGTPWRHPDGLRLDAAMCVRQGLPGDAVWGMLTSGAAAIAGVDSAVGSLAPGRDADLVLWSGNPLELGSQVEAVYVDGVPALGGAR